MIEHHLTVQFEEFKAELVLAGNWSLYGLAELILEAVKFDMDHAFEFCDNVKNPYRSTERYSVFADMGEALDEGDRGVEKTLVSEVFRVRRKMVFHFDFGDDWFFLVTCTAVKESEKMKPFRKVVASTGEPPVQYPTEEE